MKSTKKTFNVNAAIRGALRRVFSRSPVVREILEESRKVEPVVKKDGSISKKIRVYRLCQVCNQWKPSKDMQVDHIVPVIDPVMGFNNDWNDFISRLFCDKSNLQRICKQCHDKKTSEERKLRMYHQVKKDIVKYANLDTDKSLDKKSADYLKKLYKKAKQYQWLDITQQLQEIISKHGLKIRK